MQLKELRKLLKPHGFKVKIESFFWPESRRHGTIIRISDKKQMPSIFVGEDHRQEWIEAINILNKIEVWDGDEKIFI